MDETTEIDRAHAAMQAAPEDDLARLRFYERLADGEVFVLLREEAAQDAVSPEVVEVEGQAHVMVFDRIERLSSFARGPAPYATLSGRDLAMMLAGQETGLALNLEVAPSAMLIGPEAVDWLARTLDAAPTEVEARLRELTPPPDLPEGLLQALDRKLARAAGLAECAYLAGAVQEDGARGLLLALVGTAPGAEAALARAVGEALTFSGLAESGLDVTHLAAGSDMAARIARVGLRFDLPQPEARPVPGADPGMDPDKPPKLR
ncbi:SseB family protein [Salibaculum sp.]|uniref:SseB family protein n=1 Tax=Salibaculum sp. TaxID=2855480 RepID=UPI002B465396|nr:SseB family protein [Salibaculum sp.]HKL68508.1 SseB family protein [Salibaculum sp.]